MTGASRGIGKAAAIALAEAGLDVVITGRTVREGDGVDDSDGSGRSIPGSLETTAESDRGDGPAGAAGRHGPARPVDARRGRAARARRVGPHRRPREQRHRHRPRRHDALRGHAHRAARGQAGRQRRLADRAHQVGAPRHARAPRRHDRQRHVGRRGHRPAGTGRRGRLGRDVRDVEGRVPQAGRDPRRRGRRSRDPQLQPRAGVRDHRADGGERRRPRARGPLSGRAALRSGCRHRAGWVLRPTRPELNGATISAQRFALERSLHPDWRDSKGDGNESS